MDKSTATKIFTQHIYDCGICLVLSKTSLCSIGEQLRTKLKDSE